MTDALIVLAAGLGGGLGGLVLSYASVKLQQKRYRTIERDIDRMANGAEDNLMRVLRARQSMEQAALPMADTDWVDDGASEPVEAPLHAGEDYIKLLPEGYYVDKRGDMP